MLAQPLMLCLFFLALAVSRGSHSKSRTRLIVRWVAGSFEPDGRGLPREKHTGASGSIGGAIEGQAASVVDFVCRNRARKRTKQPKITKHRTWLRGVFAGGFRWTGQDRLFTRSQHGVGACI